MLPGCGREWCWCYPLRMRGVEIQISRRGHPIRASPKRLPNQHSTASATLADHTDLRRRSTLYTTRHITPIGAAEQPPYVVAQPPLNSLGLSWSKIIRLCSAYQVCDGCLAMVAGEDAVWAPPAGLLRVVVTATMVSTVWRPACAVARRLRVFLPRWERCFPGSWRSTRGGSLGLGHERADLPRPFGAAWRARKSATSATGIAVSTGLCARLRTLPTLRGPPRR
jgi:hypothetical protein